MKIELENRSQIERTIAGAIKSAIAAHGPVDRYWSGSAAKRVYGSLKQLALEQRQEDLTKDETIALLRASLLSARAALMQHGDCACGMRYYGPWETPYNGDKAPTPVQGQSFGMGRCMMCYTLMDDIDPALRLTSENVKEAA